MSGPYDFDVQEPPTTSTWAAPAPPTPDPLRLPTSLPELQQQMGQVSAVFDAANRVASYDSGTAGQFNALSDAIDARNKAVRDGSGVELENPLQNGYQAQAVQRFAQTNGGQLPDLGNPDQATTVGNYRMDAWNSAMQAMRDQHPGLIGGGPGGIGAPIGDSAAALANQAQTDFGTAVQAAGGTAASLPVTLAGGFAGSLRDPLNVAAMAVPVGGELTAATTFGRIVEGAIKSGVFNAGLTALQEPATQKWAAARGQETGLLPAAEDVGSAFLFGLPFGAAHGLLAHGPVASSVDAAAAIGGDAAAAGRVVDALPPGALPELHAAVTAEAADRSVMTDPPPGVPPAAGAQAVREALRFGEDPDAPLPNLPPSLPPDTTDTLARRVLDGQPIDPDAVAAQVEQRARGIDPASFDQATEADNAVAAARGRLADLHDDIARTLDLPSGIAPGQVAALQQQLDAATTSRVGALRDQVTSIETELAGITGKRRSSPRAKALREALPAARDALAKSVPGDAETALSAEIDRLQNAGDGLKADTVSRFAARDQILRLAVNDAVMARGRLGPRLRAARMQAEAEASALGSEGVRPTPDRALTVFQGSAAARASALASEDPSLRLLGRLASLSPEAAQAVRTGVLAPEFAQHVAAAVPDPAEHLAAVEAMAAAQPRSEREARTALTAELRNRSAPEAAQSILGGSDEPVPPAEVPSPQTPIETPGDRAKQVEQLTAANEQQAGDDEVTPVPKRRRARPGNPQTLLSFLKAMGGLRDDGGDLRAMDMHRRYPGLVNNRDGVPLDRAREAAAEAGYLGGDREAAVAGTTVNDLLAAVDSHPVYSAEDRQRAMEIQAKAADRDLQARYDNEVQSARSEVRQLFDETGMAQDPALEHAVAQYMLEHGVSADDAVEPAVMAMEPPNATIEDALEVPFDLPPDESGRVSAAGEPASGREQPPGGRAAGEPLRPASEAGATERTAAGEQGLVPGVDPITDRQRLQQRADEPLRGGDAPPPDGGLFDANARKQTDLFDAVPLADRDDGADLRLGNADDIANRTDLSSAFSQLVKDCKL